MVDVLVDEVAEDLNGGHGRVDLDPLLVDEVEAVACARLATIGDLSLGHALDPLRPTLDLHPHDLFDGRVNLRDPMGEALELLLRKTPIPGGQLRGHSHSSANGSVP